MTDSIRNLGTPETPHQTENRILGFLQPYIFPLAEGMLFISFATLFSSTHKISGFLLYAVGALGCLLTLLWLLASSKQSDALHSIASDSKEVNGFPSSGLNHKTLASGIPFILFLVWGILIWAVYQFPAPADIPQQRSKAAKPTKIPQVRFRYEGVTFFCGAKVAVISPLLDRKYLKVTTKNDGEVWEFGRKGVANLDFGIFVRHDRIYRIWVNSSEVKTEGLHNVQVGTSTQRAILKLEHRYESYSGDENPPPSQRDEDTTSFKFVWSYDSDEHGNWLIYRIGKELVWLHRTVDGQSLNQMEIFTKED